MLPWELQELLLQVKNFAQGLAHNKCLANANNLYRNFSCSVKPLNIVESKELCLEAGDKGLPLIPTVGVSSSLHSFYFYFDL